MDCVQIIIIIELLKSMATHPYFALFVFTIYKGKNMQAGVNDTNTALS